MTGHLQIDADVLAPVALDLSVKGSLRDAQHWTGCRAHYALCDCGFSQMLPPGAIMLHHNDEIAAQTAGRLDDGLGVGLGNLEWLLKRLRPRGLRVSLHPNETLRQGACLLVA